jgi:YD repeat-containing protein
MSVYLLILVVLTAAFALISVVAAVVVRRRDESYRAERQLLATRRPKRITTYEYDESGALVSTKTGPAKWLGDQLPT